MRTTIDIADNQYAELKVRAIQMNTSIRALIVEAVERMLEPRTEHQPALVGTLPVIGSPMSPKLNLNHNKVNELLADIS